MIVMEEFKINKMKKLRIYLDMDGVIADFEKAALGLKEKLPMNADNLKPDEIMDFSKFDVMPGAKRVVNRLAEAGHEIYIASTPPWNHKEAWGQKGEWIEEHFPELKKKVFLTHRKDFLIGDILIDDSDYRGQPDFQGDWIHFGKQKKIKTKLGWRTRNWRDWDEVEAYLEKTDVLVSYVK